MIHPARCSSRSLSLRIPFLGGAFLALLLAAGCGKEQKAAAPPPPAVEVMEVIRKDVPVHTDWVGTTDGLVNATIMAQEPRMMPHIPRMIGNIAEDLGVKPALINIKATTTEGLGFVGRAEGIAAQAVALIE